MNFNHSPPSHSYQLNTNCSAWLRQLAKQSILVLAAINSHSVRAEQPASKELGSINPTHNTLVADGIIQSNTPISIKTAVIPIKVQHPHILLVNDGEYVTPNTKLVEYDPRVILEFSLKHERAKLLYEQNQISLARHELLKESNSISSEEWQKVFLATELSRIDLQLAHNALQELQQVTPKFNGTVMLNNTALNPVITIKEDIHAAETHKDKPLSVPR